VLSVKIVKLIKRQRQRKDRMDSRVENFPTVDVVSFMQLFDAANIKQSNVQGLVFNQV